MASGNGTNGNGHKAIPANTEQSGKPHTGPTSWRPGQSGNPSGRPKTDARLREAIQARADELVAKLFELAGLQTDEQGNLLPGADPRVQAMCVGMLLDRGFGKAPQALTGANGEPLFPQAPNTPDEARIQLQGRSLPAGIPVN
jgi:hypothetical protein